MIDAHQLKSRFALGLPYERYVLTGNASEQANFARTLESTRLTDAQRTLIGAFTRKMPVLVLSGMWCGDCSQQCPIFARIANANPGAIDLRFLDRDEHRDLSDQVRICAGNRVPTVIWMSEDFEFCHLLGDRTISRLRSMAARYLGPACPVPGAELEPDLSAAMVADWVQEFERIHLLLRLSPRLRELHGD